MANKDCRIPVAVIVVAAVSFLNFIFVGTLYCTGLFFYHFLYTFDESKSATAVVMTLAYGTIYLAGVLSATLTTKYGSRPTAILGSLLSSIGLLLSVFASHLWMLYITYGIMAGLGWGLLMHTGAVSVQQHTTKRRALAAGISYLGSGLGAFTYPLIFRCLESTYAWRGTLLVMAGLQLNCLPAALLLIPPDPSQLNQKETEDTLRPTVPQMSAFDSDKYRIAAECKSVNVEASTSAVLFHGEKRYSCMHFVRRMHGICQHTCRTLRSGGSACVTCIMVCAFRFVAASVLYTFLPMKVASAGFEPSTAAYLISVVGIGDLVGRIVTGFTSCLHNRLPLIYYVLATLIGGVLEVCIGYIQNLTALVVLVSSIGFTIGVEISVGSTVVRDIAGIEKLPWVLGLAYGVSGINNCVSMQLMALLWQETGNLYLIFIISGICMACSGISCVIYLCLCKGRKSQL